MSVKMTVPIGLPFEPLTLVQTHRPRGFSAEAVFEQDQRERK